MTHLHTLGWTGDNGPNLFAVGWLALVTIEFTQGAGLDEFPMVEVSRREEEEFMQLLLMFITVIDDE